MMQILLNAAAVKAFQKVITFLKGKEVTLFRYEPTGAGGTFEIKATGGRNKYRYTLTVEECTGDWTWDMFSEAIMGAKPQRGLYSMRISPVSAWHPTPEKEAAPAWYKDIFAGKEDFLSNPKDYGIKQPLITDGTIATTKNTADLYDYCRTKGTPVVETFTIPGLRGVYLEGASVTLQTTGIHWGEGLVECPISIKKGPLFLGERTVKILSKIAATETIQVTAWQSGETIFEVLSDPLSLIPEDSHAFMAMTGSDSCLKGYPSEEAPEGEN